jgi:hypothetical protein
MAAVAVAVAVVVVAVAVAAAPLPVREASLAKEAVVFWTLPVSGF